MNGWFNKKLLILLLILVVLRLPYLDLPLERDEGAYAYIGRIWLRGLGIPYVSAFDHKPPLVYIPYGLINLVWGDGYNGIRLAALGYSFLIIGGFYWLSVQLFGKRQGFICGLLMAVYLSSFRLQGFGFNTEILLLLPILIFLGIVWKSLERARVTWGYWIGTGLIAAMAVWFKPVAIYPVLLVLSYAVVKLRSVKLIASFAVGFLIPSLAFFIYFWKLNAEKQLIDNVILYNKSYVLEGFLPEYLCHKPNIDWGCLVAWIGRTHIAIVVLTSVGIVALVKTLLAKKTTQMWLIWFFMGGVWLATKGAGGKNHPHYYLLWLPGLIWIVTWWTSRLWTEGKYVLTTIIIFFLLLWVPFIEYPWTMQGNGKVLMETYGSTEGKRFMEAVDVGKWITHHVGREEKLWVFANEPEIYYYARKLAHGRHINTFGFLYKEGWKEWVNKLKNYPVEWIVTYNSKKTREMVNIYFGKYTVEYKTGEFLVMKRVRL